uniref:Uncharacterized protein n=1 Tax=Romanomermis culicivorax TaxID=13658 RepID=A0A915HFK1_ROMCU
MEQKINVQKLKCQPASAVNAIEPDSNPSTGSQFKDVLIVATAHHNIFTLESSEHGEIKTTANLKTKKSTKNQKQKVTKKVVKLLKIIDNKKKIVLKLSK